MEETLTIGKVAKGAGVGVETVRFYEREGLLPAPPRRPSGYRQYPLDTVRRIRFVLQAKELGFTLKEIKELLALRVGGPTRCSTVRARAEAKLENIDEKLAVLKRMRRTLRQLTRACESDTETDDCPILDALGADQ